LPFVDIDGPDDVLGEVVGAVLEVALGRGQLEVIVDRLHGRGILVSAQARARDMGDSRTNARGGGR
jgi:hypothetical protein